MDKKVVKNLIRTFAVASLVLGASLTFIEGKEMIVEDHCYCCTDGAGLSCGGALV